MIVAGPTCYRFCKQAELRAVVICVEHVGAFRLALLHRSSGVVGNIFAGCMLCVSELALPPPGKCTALRRHGAGALHRCSAPQPIPLNPKAVKAWQCSGAGLYTLPLRQTVRWQAESTVQQRLVGASSTALARCLALQAPAQGCARQACLGRVCRSVPCLATQTLLTKAFMDNDPYRLGDLLDSLPLYCAQVLANSSETEPAVPADARSRKR